MQKMRKFASGHRCAKSSARRQEDEPVSRLSGKIAIVTGAASGIGAASAKLFADEGAQVLAVDRPQSAIEQVHAGNNAIAALACDITGEDAPKRIVAAALDKFGAIDVLFNNAGVSGRVFVEEMTDAEWDHVNDVNLRAMFRLCREAIPELKARAKEKGRARIVNTASVMAFDTDYGLAAYCASKAGVGGLTRTLALELGKFNITANYICPGAIYTGLTRDNFDKPEIRAVWEKKAALRRLGQPIDIARAALLLACDEADFITGHELVVDGGLTLRT
jgi:NAD(P)-dependent dehydrogenase (short-subunit alcohol dehydrogenase family)